MTQEDKELLLKDLCARLPYGVKVINTAEGVNEVCELDSIMTSRKYKDNIFVSLTLPDDSVMTGIEMIKPYLRSMSSMTEEERKELLDLLFDKEAKDFYIDEEGFIDGKTSDLMKEGLNYPAFCPINVKIYTDYLNAHHFDWRIDSNGRTFIEKGLALEAPEGMYK